MQVERDMFLNEMKRERERKKSWNLTKIITRYRFKTSVGIPAVAPQRRSPLSPTAS